MNYADSFGFQWSRYRATQLDSHTGLTLSAERLWNNTRWAPADLRGRTVLDAGCWPGRFTEVLLAAGARVVGLDLSRAVFVNRELNARKGELALLMGDIANPPFGEASFDFVFCYGVLQHTPDPHAAFQSLVKFLKPGGRLAVDVYKKGVELEPYKSKYLWRPLTTRMSRERLLRIIQWYVPRWLPFDTVIKKAPGIGGLAGMLVPCWNYSSLPLSRPLQIEWAILDTFDALAPAYDFPQTMATVGEWFREAGLADIDVRLGGNGVLGNGRAPDPGRVAVAC